MKISLAILLASSIFFTNSGGLGCLAANIGQVKSDISQIASRVSALNKVINNFPPNGGTLQNGIEIQTKVNDAKKALDKCTTDAKTTPQFSDTDSKAIFSSVSNLSQGIINLLNGVIAKHSSIVKIPFPGISTFVRNALKELKSSVDGFEDALRVKSTASVQAQAAKLKAQVDRAFAGAINAYSS